MKLFTTLAYITAAGLACNQMASSSEEQKIHKPVADLVSENMKGNIQQVVTETYSIDSATGKMGKLESKATEIYNDNGVATSYTNYTSKDNSTMLSKYEHDANGYMTGIT